MAAHNDLGQWGEDFAADYLRTKGYEIRERDWHSGRRDLDIIALTPDKATLVFVGVKTRMPGEPTAPEDAINRSKVRNLGLAANAYVKSYGVTEELRFDIITVVGSSPADAKLVHEEDAFNPLLVY